MTRKDYVLIAGVLKAGRDYASAFAAPHARVAHYDELATRMADALASTNPRLDRERFLSACGVAA